MASVNVDLPEELFEAAALNRANASKEASRLLALELFHEGKVSLGRAAELCLTPLEAFMDFASTHGVNSLQYGQAELESDRKTFEQLGF